MKLIRHLGPTLLLWLLMTALLFLVLDMTDRALRAERAVWANEEIDELLSNVSFWSAFDDSDREIEVDFEDWPSFATFRTAYIQAIAERSPSPATSARLVLLGEEARVEPAVPPEYALRLMLEETPEIFHERLEQLAAIHWGSLEEFDEERLTLPTLEILQAWLEEESEPLEELESCAALLDAEGSTVASNLTQIPDWTTEPMLLRRVPFEDEPSVQRPCIAVQRRLGDRSRVILGVESPAAMLALEEFGGASLLAALLIGTLAMSYAWIAHRRRTAALLNLRDACRRAGEGDYSVRIAVNGKEPVDEVAHEINRVLERTETLVDSLQSMSANIAHDLRTPLTRLRGQIDLLLRTPNPDTAMVAAVQAEADQLLDTFSALLRIGQVESGSLRQGFRDFDLLIMLKDAVELYQPAFEEQKISLTSKLPKGALVVHGDQDLWMQSVANLMDNVLKYVPEEEGLTITLSQQADVIELTFRDTGPGIPDLELDRVLDRFYRLPKHRGEQGNGLGLSLVAAVCQLHNAELTLRNSGGLAVEIRWPQQHQVRT
ncbi:MAG: HAMP domain-containing sensor histidine kinase [Pseudomonadota bacterium]